MSLSRTDVDSRDSFGAGLERVAESLRSLRRELRAVTGNGARHEGRDSSGTVTMAADNAGVVESVLVDSAWFSRRSALSLGPALLEAYQALIAEVMGASVEMMDEAEEAERHRTVHIHDHALAPAGRARSAAVRLPDFDEVREALRSLEERQYEKEYQRMRRRVDRPAETVVYGPYHVVAVSVRDGEVAEIAVLDNVGRDRISTLQHDVVAALRAMRGAGSVPAERTGEW